MNSAPQVPVDLSARVKTTFERARANGNLNYYPTNVAVLRYQGTAFQLRFSPSLANKPNASKSPSTKILNPFESPPLALTVCSLPPYHVLVLNKFAIVPGHFLLITTTFKPQTDLLEPRDIAAAYACIEAYDEDGGQDLFAFFNSGEHSGASQSHRHIQLLPVARMKEGLAESGTKWEVLADHLVQGGPTTSRAVPFAVYGVPIPRTTEGAVDDKLLHQAYLRLYHEACVRVLGEAESTSINAQVGGPARVSYNMAMTRKSLILSPRKADGQIVVARAADGAMREVGRLSLNGTFLAGTALVKSEAEFVALKEDATQLWSILGSIGYSSDGETGKL